MGFVSGNADRGATLHLQTAQLAIQRGKRGRQSVGPAGASDRAAIGHVELLRVGQAVRIMAGPLGDLPGELIELDDSGRIRVLIDFLDGRIPVSLPLGEVMAAR